MLRGRRAQPTSTNDAIFLKCSRPRPLIHPNAVGLYKRKPSSFYFQIPRIRTGFHFAPQQAGSFALRQSSCAAQREVAPSASGPQARSSLNCELVLDPRIHLGFHSTVTQHRPSGPIEGRFPLNGCFCAPCKGTVFQRGSDPPGNCRSSR